MEISEALSGLGGVVLQHEGSFIATEDHAGQDSPPDPCADKSHGRYLVSWLSRGWREDVHEHFLQFTSIPLARLPPGLGKLASFWFHPDPNYRQGRESTTAIRGKSRSSLTPADPQCPSPGHYPPSTEKLRHKTWGQRPTPLQWMKTQ